MMFCYRLILHIMLIVSILACGNSDKPTVPSQLNGVLNPDLREIWHSTDITTCWANPSPENIVHRRAVRSIIIEQMNERTLYNFIGWQDCNKIERFDLSVRLTQSGKSRVSLFGARIRGLASGLRININPQIYQVLEGCKDNLAMPCLQAVALHEFGHVLGLRHEHHHYTSECKGPYEPSGRSLNYVSHNAFDSHSIMNYCFLNNEMHRGHKVALSNNDIILINEVSASIYCYHQFADTSQRQAICLNFISQYPDKAKLHSLIVSKISQ